MASVAQIQANRLNAQKSTGPRTAQGKAAASRNAVKHGLLAEQVVIHGEDPAQFDLYRAGMLAELAPVGAVEAMLAERAVSLSWRLRRAERLQSAVFATVYRENANDVVLWPKHGLPIQPGPDEEEVILGQVVMTDFARAQVLDRLLVHERRIESSLYRTMRELRREREARAAAVAEEALRSEDAMTLLTSLTAAAAAATDEVPRSEGGLATAEEPAAAAKLGSFGADVVSGVQGRKTAFGSSEPPAGVACGTGILPVVRNHGRDAHATGAAGGNHGRDARATGTLHDPSCETKPISDGVSRWAFHSRESGSLRGMEGAF